MRDYIWERIKTQLDEFVATVEIAEVLKINENYVEDLVEKNERFAMMRRGKKHIR